MPGPLDGIRVIDLTQMISGPMATMILADQGADVIKVEPPGIGDLVRAMGGRKSGMSPTFVVANRNKRSIVIDLKQPRGLEVLKRLIPRADVVVQNFCCDFRLGATSENDFINPHGLSLGTKHRRCLQLRRR